MAIITLNVYDAFIGDLVNGNFTPSTNTNALLVSGAYAFSPTHATLSAVTSFELSGGSYARASTAVQLTPAAVGDQYQYTPSSPWSFAAFTGTWQSVIIFNPSTSVIYFCASSDVAISNVATSTVLQAGVTPFASVGAI